MRIGVDLGTDSVLAWVPKQGVIVREPCVLARDAASGRVLACGQAARQMVARVTPDVRLVTPVEAGRVGDPEAASLLVAHLLRQALGWRWSFSRTSLYVAVGEQPNSYGWHALLHALRRAQVGKVTLVPRAVAAARGAGLPIDSARGSAIVDLGAGTTEIAVLSLGQIVAARSLALGGRALDEAIRSYVASRHDLEISLSQARQVKHELGWATPGAQSSLRLWGRHHATGLPLEVELGAEEIHEALAGPLSRIALGVHQALEQVPPGLAADLVDGGLLLTGGGALLRGIDTYLSDQLHLPVRRADDPLACTACGALVMQPAFRPVGWRQVFSRQSTPALAK